MLPVVKSICTSLDR